MVLIMTKKTITAVSIFFVLFSGAWMLNERSKPELYEPEKQKGGFSIQSEQPMKAQKAQKFRPREYVRIVTP